jgi:hypothetical protein
MTTIKQEYLDWWNNLHPSWKKVFLKSIYEPAEPEGFVDITDYQRTEPKQPEDILKIFELEEIDFVHDVDPDSEQAISSIPPLKFFKKLQRLGLDYHALNSLEHLQEAKTVKIITISENFMEDNQQLRYLSGLPELEELDLSLNLFTDLSLIKDLPKLKVLRFFGNPYPVDISSLVQFPNLEEVMVDIAEDVTPLTQIKTIKTIHYGSDQEEFDCSKLEWLIQQLPKCNFELTFSDDTQNTLFGDLNFLYYIIVKCANFPNVIDIYPPFQENEKTKLLALEKKYRKNEKMYPLVSKAIAYFEADRAKPRKGRKKQK